jgi:hypothetical protein
VQVCAHSQRAHQWLAQEGALNSLMSVIKWHQPQAGAKGSPKGDAKL